jgi:hypothetical protein
MHIFGAAKPSQESYRDACLSGTFSDSEVVGGIQSSQRMQSLKIAIPHLRQW